MARRDHGQRKRRGEGKAFPSGRAARLSFETDLRGYGFEEPEIEAAWSRRDGVERVAIELMAIGGRFGVDRGFGERCGEARPEYLRLGRGGSDAARETRGNRTARMGRMGNTNRPAVGGKASQRARRRGFRASRRDRAKAWLGCLSSRDFWNGGADHRSPGALFCDRAGLSSAQGGMLPAIPGRMEPVVRDGEAARFRCCRRPPTPRPRPKSGAFFCVKAGEPRPVHIGAEASTRTILTYNANALHCASHRW